MRTLFRGLGAVPSPHRAWTYDGRRRLAVLTVSGLVLTVTAACSNEPTEDPGQAKTAVSHVHALVTNPADGSLLAATHEGVFKIESGAARLIGQGRQDTMGLAVIGPDQFYASGHPEPSKGTSPHLGLIKSTDATKTWTTMSMEGQADFHSLVPTETGVYGYNSVTSTLMHSEDGKEWTDLLKADMYDIAADPQDTERLLLTTQQGVQTYRRGAEPELIPETAGIALIEWADDSSIIGLKVDGRIVVSNDEGRSWSPAGNVKGDIEAFGASPDAWQVATSDGIFESTDKGKTWARILDVS